MHIFNSARLKERRDGLSILNEILKDKRRCLIIHYSCESFITNHGNTPRVTSICIKNLQTSQTESFSIHLQAQFEGKDFNNLNNEDYDSLELVMLNDFSEYVKKHSTYKWIHWNMRDSNYGFTAINNRIRILKGSTFEIPDDFKFDFPKILSLIYTAGYENNRPDGRLLNLANRNSISVINGLTGGEEAAAFDNKEYLKLHMSTLKKVDVIDSIIHKTEIETLKVAISDKHVYGLTIPGIIELIKVTPWLLVIASIVGYIVGAVLEPIVQKLFETN